MRRNKLSRAERRRKKHCIEKNVQAISKLTPVQYDLIEKITEKKANKHIDDIAKIINECYFKAMRSNGISEVRANKILAETEEFIKIEANKSC